ncbi:MAG TPA: tRNA pseudouridine(38-40) synthase TruA [Flavisolibacter sp.]|nr:tRNA pseudouridine(38-40) synthase TruA [Flavisolibacter sp.]HWJ91573.1 tRNA pseudouridine(38-40) synthase TruA [Flavisolibacter sp.]
MSRYFLELSYRGTRFSGFQTQENASTVQSEIEKAFEILHRRKVALTGSSRTDAGVHARQNFFHFDSEQDLNPQFIYKMNAILPDDIALKEVFLMPPGAHCRFDAVSRQYRYHLHRFKNPFLRSASLFYPYTLDLSLMHEAAALVEKQKNFFAFAKTNTQVKNFNCDIISCNWEEQGEELVFKIEANRFLRGMVRLLTASLLKVGRHKLSIEAFRELMKGDGKCGFSVPAHGLFLVEVKYPANFFPAPGLSFTPF